MEQTKKRPDAGGAAAQAYIPSTFDLPANYSPVELLLPRLDGVRRIADDKYAAFCPCAGHSGKNRNLHIREAADGTVLLICRSRGHTAAEVVSDVGLELYHLFPPKPYRAVRRKDNLTPAKRREYRKLLEDEIYIWRFGMAVLSEGQDITPEDAARLLLADDRVQKLRGLLNE